MNYTLTTEIATILKSLTDAEKERFKTSGNKKDGKAFIELFNCYFELIENSEGEILPDSIKEKFTGNFADTNKYLGELLYNFLIKLQEEKEQSTPIMQLENNVKICNQLIARMKFKLALKYLKEIVEDLESLKSHQPKSEEIIVAFRVYPLITELMYKADENTRKKLMEFRNLYIDPFYNIAWALQNKQQSWNQTHSNESQQYIFNQLEDFAFFSMLKSFVENTEHYANFFDQDITFNASFANALQSLESFDSQSKKVSEITKRQLGEAVNFYHLISSFYTAAETANELEFMQQFRELTRNLWLSANWNENSFPLALGYYFKQKIFEAQVIYISKSGYQMDPLKMLDFNPTEDLKEQLIEMYENIHFFKQNEYDDTAIRLELNNLIYLFLANRFNDFIDAYDKLIKIDPVKFGENLPYLKLLQLISSCYDIRPIAEENQNDILSWFSRSKELNEFEKKAFQIIRIKIENKELKDKLMQDLKSIADNKNHFQMVIIKGIESLKKL